MVRSLTFLLIVALCASPTRAQDGANPVERALADSTWESTAGAGVRAYYKPGSFAERHRAMLVRSAGVSLDQVLNFLGEREYDPELHIFYVESRDEMNALVGYPVTGFAVWSGHGIFLVVNPTWRSFEKHEMTHIVTMTNWGEPDSTSRWMVEGICICCDGWCRTRTVDEIARYLLDRGKLPPLRDLFANPRALGEIPAGMYAASVIGYLRATYGIAAVRDIWLHGPSHLREATGATADEIEAAWKSYLRAKQGGDVDYDAIEKSGCG